MAKCRAVPASTCVGALCGLLLMYGCVERPTGEAVGPALYETCAPCHGEDGAGVEAFSAPAIAGLPEWYLLSQLEKFQEGHRGAHPDDVNGLRMRGMARTLNHEGDLQAVVTHIGSMPPAQPAPTLGGDPGRGQPLYAACVECHGEAAAGNLERNAPPLTSLDDWYIASQLGLFKAGIRGTTDGDATGAEMRPMAIGLANEQAMADVAAYIATLRGG